MRINEWHKENEDYVFECEWLRWKKRQKKSEKTCYEGVAEQIGENNKTKDADMIFLSEINTQKNELKEVFWKK